MARVTVLLPVHRPPALLPYAIESVLAQTHQDFQLIVVCDGAPAETAACADAYAARDPRIKTFARPKGERHGEAHRHAALMELGTGDHVAHIGDEDLWFPDHLEEIERLLADADFGHVICTFIHADGSVEALASDITAPDVRARFINKRYNCFGPTDCGYRLAAYRSLAEGWAPAPPDVWSDLHMWRKFLQRDDLAFASRAVVTSLHFSASERTAMSLAERAAENESWWRRLQDPDERHSVAERAIRSISQKCVRHDMQYLALEAAYLELVRNNEERARSLAEQEQRAGEPGEGAQR
jgi:glycosyltransferase involved in cell wall biosynthesis